MRRSVLLLGVLAACAACSLNHTSFVESDAEGGLDTSLDTVDDTADARDATSEDAAEDIVDVADVPTDDGPAVDADVIDTDVVDVPDVPDVPDVLDVPDVPDVSDVPDVPDVPDVSDVPDVPDVADDGPIVMDIPCVSGMTRCGGVCVDTATDGANCGACGRTCGASQTCTAGTCACASGTGDCDGNAANGCETDLTNSTTNCGRCGNACQMRSNSTPSCTGGVCVPQCGAGFGNCDGMEPNGCEENLTTSASHCGACGNACSLRANAATMTCRAGACAVDMCVNGFGDCNMAEADGCEIAGFANPSHCGGCNHPCAAGQACVLSACTACASPRVMCVGACVDTGSDSRNCGACGTVCSPGQSCSSGRCVCPTGQMLCSGACVNLQSDRLNCGACGNACATNGSCSGGTCRCPFGTERCGSRCVSTAIDNANCGSCGNACAACFLSACVCGARGRSCCPLSNACGPGLTCRSGTCS